MKVQNLNNSSRKTRRLIRRVFAEMLCENGELGKISVSELCKRAEISRGTFYSHFDDIYAVAEDYENEMIDTFFDQTRLLASRNIMEFVDAIFQFIRENHENYRLLCKSNDFLFAAKKLTAIASDRFLELCQSDSRIQNREHIALELQVFLNGLLWEYVKYCRDCSDNTLEDLYAYTKFWVSDFIQRRSE